jgi:hypothetical protein
MARTQTSPSPDAAYGAATVTVACKMPNGVWLQLHELVECTEPHPALGTRQVKQARKVGEPIMVKGYRGLPFGIDPKIDIAGGYALTPGVPRDFWKKWFEQNKHSALVKNHLIFAHHERASVDDFATGNETIRCGLEPIDPDKPMEKLGGRVGNVGNGAARLGISTADE